MLSVPKPEDFEVSSVNGFLPTLPPLESLPNSYYEPWERIAKNLQGLILSKRLREVVDTLPVLSTDRLQSEPEWRRAYSLLAFVAHAYIWDGKRPAERVPPPITIPFLATCKHLELPPVATYAGLVLWNWKPIFSAEPVDTLANLDTIDTFTGSLDEKWFYLVSIAIEARAAPIIPLMLQAIEAADKGDRAIVTECLCAFAERLDELGSMLGRMYENCDPHVFYHRIRPYLAGSKNMGEAGLPNGVVFDDGGPINKQRYVQFSGGSNAQSSIIQFFDVVLNIQHRPTGTKKPADASALPPPKPKMGGVPSLNFIHEQRTYMPGPHARFLEQVSRVANILPFVQDHSYDPALCVAYDSCLAMLSAFRDRHIQLVSRYIIIKSREAKLTSTPASKPSALAALPQQSPLPQSTDPTSTKKPQTQDLTGTGGTSLIPFLRQARDETSEQAINLWTRRILSKDKTKLLLLGRKSGSTDEKQVVDTAPATAVAVDVNPDIREEILRFVGPWKANDVGGGLCNY